MPRARRNSEAIPISDLISRVMQRRGLSRGSEHRMVFDAWNRVVPEAIAARARPVSFRAGRLIVAVASAPLMEELRCFRAGEFLRLLNQNLSQEARAAHVVVRRVEFRRS